MTRERAHAAEASGVARVVQFVVAATTENWGTKILAFLLALMVFIVTRDEITRSFSIPLRVLDDPDRVLLTQLPGSVELRVRGPWANVNRLSAAQLGTATLDLREARPGPMVLDPASVVMPQGVMLDTLDYDPIDLRFEALVEQALRIVPVVTGEVDPDYKLEAMRVEPNSWTVRAPASVFDDELVLRTEVVDIGGATASIDERIELEAAADELSLLGVGAGERPSVRLMIDVVPIAGELELEVATAAALREAVPELAEVDVPVSEHVVIGGPRRLLRELEGREAPLRAVVEVDEGPRGRTAAIPVTVRFEWSAELPAATVEQLSITPALVRLRLSPSGVESQP